MKIGKRTKDFRKKLDPTKVYSLKDVVGVMKAAPAAKFDETIDLNIKLGVDPKKADQMVRGTVSLPHGTGKNVRVVVIAKGDKAKEALAAGADHAGEEIVDKIKDGWTDFDCLIVTPDMMAAVGKLGKVLGPRGLMPNPKAGTVTQDVAKAVKEVKAGKIEFKVDKSACIHVGVAKVSFSTEAIVENLTAVIQAIQKAKPVAAKGIYLRSVFVSSTMGPGLKVQVAETV